MTRSRIAPLALALVVAGGLAACTDSSGSSTEPSTPATAEAPEPITLRIGTDDLEDAPSAAQIRRFGMEVAALSDGAMTIRPVWKAAGEGVRHWDQAIVRLVVDGEIDLALVPSRAWDDLGVTSLSVLNAPFVVDSDDLTERVVTELGDDLLNGLPAVGVTGLALLPEGLRHPFGYDAPLLAAEDFRHATIRAPYSRTTTAMFRALGATPTDDPPDPGTQTGTETSYALGRGGVATGNVVFYPKVNTLVIDEEARTGLSEAQWSVLTEAADNTTAWVLENNPTDTAAAREFCREGGRIAAADEADLRSLLEATRPVIDSLAEDPTTAVILGRIEELKAGIAPPQPVTRCRDRARDAASQLNGVYKTLVTARSLSASGVSQDNVSQQAGRYTITFRDGSWEMEQIYTHGTETGQTWYGSGHYTFRDGRLRFFWAHTAGQWTEADVTIGDDGSLSFSGHEDGMGAEAVLEVRQQFREWKRVGDAP